MINIRVARKDDLPQIDELCKKNNIVLPQLEYCLVVENESGVITGLANVVTTPTIDCFIAETPISARKLFDTVCGGMMATGKNAVQFFTKREDVAELYKHLDLTIYGNTYTVARKEF